MLSDRLDSELEKAKKLTEAKKKAEEVALVKKGFLGCFVVFWQLFVATPIWLGLMFGILYSLPVAPTWVWILFFSYLFSHCTYAILYTVFHSIKGG